MNKKWVYILEKDGKQIVGSVKEVSKASGYSASRINHVALGDEQTNMLSDGTIVKRMLISEYSGYQDVPEEKSEKTVEMIQNAVLMEEWDNVVSKFKKVKWVQSEGRRLSLNG